MLLKRRHVSPPPEAGYAGTIGGRRYAMVITETDLVVASRETSGRFQAVLPTPVRRFPQPTSAIPLDLELAAVRARANAVVASRQLLGGRP